MKGEREEAEKGEMEKGAQIREQKFSSGF